MERPQYTLTIRPKCFCERLIALERGLVENRFNEV